MYSLRKILFEIRTAPRRKAAEKAATEEVEKAARDMRPRRGRFRQDVAEMIPVFQIAVDPNDQVIVE